MRLKQAGLHRGQHKLLGCQLAGCDGPYSLIYHAPVQNWKSKAASLFRVLHCCFLLSRQEPLTILSGVYHTRDVMCSSAPANLSADYRTATVSCSLMLGSIVGEKSCLLAPHGDIKRGIEMVWRVLCYTWKHDHHTKHPRDKNGPRLPATLPWYRSGQKDQGIPHPTTLIQRWSVKRGKSKVAAVQCSRQKQLVQKDSIPHGMGQVERGRTWGAGWAGHQPASSLKQQDT